MCMNKVVSIDGDELDSTFKVGVVSEIAGLIIESWGPKDRNPDYGKAFETIITRLRKKKINQIQVHVISRNLVKAYPNIEDRAIEVNKTKLIDILSDTPEDVRKLIGKEVGNLKEPSVKSSKGGNRYKRILISHHEMTENDWHDIALGKFQPTFDELELESLVDELVDTNFSEPSGSEHPNSINRTSIAYERDPRVKAWTLKQANGHCEYCGQEAPFTKENGKPYLEVHHVEPLAQGGADTTSNTVALCPNCHRAFHFSAQKLSMIQKVKQKVARLK